MPMHDWTRVEAGVYHDFHQTWITHLKEALNGGLLPPPFYALLEQVAVRPSSDRVIPDVLALESREPDGGAATGLQTRKSLEKLFRGDLSAYRRKKGIVAIRHATGDRVVAMIELVSPGNKSGTAAFREFLEKSAALLTRGVHLLVIDPFPPTPRDPQGFHAALWDHLYDEVYLKPTDKALTFASYEACDAEVYGEVEHLSVGDPLPDMPLFLVPNGCVPLPLEATYTTAWRSVPQRWQRVIAGT